MDSVEFSKFRHDSVHALMRLNDTCDRTFKVLTWPRWDYDLDAGTLTFSQDGIASVVASILSGWNFIGGGGNLALELGK